MRTRVLSSLVASTLAVMLAASPAHAQNAPHGKQQVISIQPLSAMLTVYAGELERVLSPSLSLGAGATYWDAGENDGEATYLSGDLKLRYYPSGNALHGFSFGGSVGMTRVEGEDDVEGTPFEVTGPTIGTMFEYSWLLNQQRSFYMGIGAGVKALFIDEDDVDDDVALRYPTVRFSVGWAF